jgi:hypothetical protein
VPFSRLLGAIGAAFAGTRMNEFDLGRKVRCHEALWIFAARRRRCDASSRLLARDGCFSNWRNQCAFSDAPSSCCNRSTSNIGSLMKTA